MGHLAYRDSRIKQETATQLHYSGQVVAVTSFGSDLKPPRNIKTTTKPAYVVIACAAESIVLRPSISLWVAPCPHCVD